MPGHKISQANVVPFPKGKTGARLMPGHKIFQANVVSIPEGQKQGVG